LARLASASALLYNATGTVSCFSLNLAGPAAGSVGECGVEMEVKQVLWSMLGTSARQLLSQTVAVFRQPVRYVVQTDSPLS
jgi:hypothetical protein